MRVFCDERQLELPGRRASVVLGSLLLTPGQVVLTEQLIQAMYAEDPPTTARNQVQRGVSELRRLGLDIRNESTGYVLRVDRDCVDAYVFDDLCARARTAVRSGNPGEGARAYRAALALWRGPVLSELDSPVLMASAGRWEERRIIALEERIDAELELGLYQALAPELAGLVRDYPLCEKFQEQYIRVLHHMGRTAAALKVYESFRAYLAETFGSDPCIELRTLRQTLLAPAPATATTPGPRQLPPATPGLTGRGDEVGQVRRALDQNRIALITGPGGIGKTTVAVEVAHQIKDEYPNGQLFIDLGGASDWPAEPGDVLARFLRELGLSDPEIPDELDRRSACFRSIVAERPVLLVLDNAASSAQVRPLLPGTPGSAVIVTSRPPLAELDGASRTPLAPLTREDSRRLLTEAIGAAQLADDPATVDRLLKLMGGSPLALRILAARLTAKPHWSLSHLLSRIKENPLDELRSDGLHMRAILDVTYRSLPPEARRLFRLIGSLRLSDVCDWTATALADATEASAGDLLETLADGYLLRAVEPARFQCHDIILAYARERADAEESQDQQRAAVERVMGTLLTQTDAAYASIHGRQPPYASAARRPIGSHVPAQLGREWLAANLCTINQAIRCCAEYGLAEHCWELAISLLPLFESGGYNDEWLGGHEVALEAVHRSGDQRGQAMLWYSLGHRATLRGAHEEAMTLLKRAQALFERIEDLHGQGLIALDLGLIAYRGEELRRARDAYARAMKLFRRTADAVHQARALHGLVTVLEALGNTLASDVRAI
ncbi:NB-ARC domain-containing protein [Nonomuraea sp. NBC_00507]|uniref:AfsR/SARP family transcriptional regulator n=1 Tax=Nonomuraea sp. NBC_00507 TaxID=2976002 RepID=UPI002E192066